MVRPESPESPAYTAASRLKAAGLHSAVTLFTGVAGSVPIPKPPHPVVLADFAAFRERLVSANHEREARFAAHQAELSALFARSGQPVDDGRQFIQPMRVHLLHPLPPG